MALGEWWRRILYAVNRRRIERELEEEMAAHREMMEDPRRFGSVLKLREESRDVWGWGPIERAAQDVRHAVRVLRRAPAFSTVAVLILSAGIGLNLTFFHLLNVTTLQPPPVEDPATLVRFNRRSPTFWSSGFPYPATQFIRRHDDTLAAVLTRQRSDVVWDEDPATKVSASYVSANWFAQMGYGAAMGRVFAEALDEKPASPPVVVVSHQFWRARLGSDPEVAGRPLRLNDRTATIVGVAPASFPDLDFDNPQIWLPIAQVGYFNPGTTLEEDWSANSVEFYGRLPQGVSPKAGAERLQTAVAALARERPGNFKPNESLEPVSAEVRFRLPSEQAQVAKAAGLVGGLALLVLLVASANLANLVLSHAIGRLRELSIRAALGASRRRILRHIVIECALLAALGAFGGLVAGIASARLLASLTLLPPYLDFTPDWRLLAAALAVGFVAMLAFGLVPAWMVSRRDLLRAMRDGGQQVSAGLARARLRVALVAAQVIGCCALLVVAGAMARGLQKLLVTGPGFAPDRLVVLEVPLDRHGVRGEAARDYWRAVAETIARHPDLEALTFATPAPLGGAISERTYATAPSLRIANLRVDSAFFRVLGIPLLAGRTFTPADDRDPVVIVSRRLALGMYGSLDVLGKGFPSGSSSPTIVGVAADAAVTNLRSSNGGEQYAPMDPGAAEHVVLVARSRTTPDTLAKPLHDAARAADPRVQPAVRLLAEEYDRQLRGPRLASTIAALVAGLVLTLACLGIFGVVSFGVQLRTKEIGIRRALGADARNVCAVLVRGLAIPVGLGMLIGTAAGVAVGRLLVMRPFDFAVADASAPAAALVVVVVAGLVAALVPASRALRADPLEALRVE